MSSTHHRLSSLAAAPRRRAMPKLFAVLSARVRNHYRGLPPWLLLAQSFLAFGWLRAAVAHWIDPNWWDGDEIAGFVVDHRPDSVEWYGATMLDGPIESWPAVIAVIVLAVQVVVAALLVANVRPLFALLLGAGLNVNFMLAGAVNPSVFYLVISAALALWHIENSMTLAGLHRLTTTSTLIGAMGVGALIPEVRTVDPAIVIEDPALVLTFATLLWVGALQINVRSAKMLLPRPIPAGPDDQTHTGVVRRPSGGPPVISGMVMRRCDRPGRNGMGLGRDVRW